MKLFKYGGTVSSNLIVVDTADIKFGQFFNGFDKSMLSDDESEMIKQIERLTIREDVKNAVTLSDDRLIFIANKLMVKYPGSRSEYGLNEWTIVYEFLMRFYDKSLFKLDDVIRFVNLWIGMHYAEDDGVSPDETVELVTLSGILSGSPEKLKESYGEILPQFVMERISTTVAREDIPSDKISAVQRNSYNKAIDSLIEVLSTKS